MTNTVTLCLILSTFLAAEVLTETPEGDVIVKEGRRVVVVEYEKEGKANTKIVISPPGTRHGEADDGAGKGLSGKETASHVPTSREEGEARERHVTPGELMCDAFGKCRHKIASALEKAEDMVSRVPGEKALEETMGQKDRDTKDKVTEKAQEVVEKVGPKAQRAWGRAAEVGRVVGVTGVATAFGTCMWVTFVSSYILAGVLGRHQFGLVQSKAYPLYFRTVSLGILVGLLGHLLDRRRVDMSQAFNLLASLVMVEANAAFLEPRATKAMFERMKAEKEGGGEAASQRLRKLSQRLLRLNTYSSWLNILTLVSLTWHLVFLGLRLSLSC